MNSKAVVTAIKTTSAIKNVEIKTFSKTEPFKKQMQKILLITVLNIIDSILKGIIQEITATEQKEIPAMSSVPTYLLHPSVR